MNETPLCSPSCGSVPLQPCSSLQISLAPADIGLPRQAWEVSPKPMPCPRSLQIGEEQQPMLALRAGWREAELAPQLEGAASRVSQCCPGRLGQLGLLEEGGSSRAPGRGGGSRQQPHKPEEKEATSLGQLCWLVRNRVDLPRSARATSASAVLGL